MNLITDTRLLKYARVDYRPMIDNSGAGYRRTYGIGVWALLALTSTLVAAGLSFS